jgi:hypothetical protein
LRKNDGAHGGWQLCVQATRRRFCGAHILLEGLAWADAELRRTRDFFVFGKNVGIFGDFCSVF